MSLPEPARVGEMTLEEALQLRRSVRSYTDEPITLEELSQLLWAAQGITSDEGFRTAPSAGALYPLQTYAVVGNVEGLKTGIYKYSSLRHELIKVREGDFRPALSEEALSQSQIGEAAVDIVIAAVYERTTEKYGERGRRYVHIEVGHAGQNICLQAECLNLGVCPIGGFEDDGIKRVLGLPEDEDPLYILSVGRVW
ncbi:MAG: SagB/ThcOx family dehydrogenase [bacterium]